MTLTWLRVFCLLLALSLLLTVVDAKYSKKDKRVKGWYRDAKPRPPGPAIQAPHADDNKTVDWESKGNTSCERLEEAVKYLKKDVKALWYKVKSGSSSSVAPVYVHVHGDSHDKGYKGYGHGRSPGRGSPGHGHDRSHRGSPGRSHRSGKHGPYRGSPRRSHRSHGRSPYGHGRSGRHGFRSYGHRSGRSGRSLFSKRSRHFGSPRGRSHKSGHHFWRGHGSPRGHFRSHHSRSGRHGHGSPRGHYRSRHSPSGGHGHGPWGGRGDRPGTHVHVHVKVDQKPPYSYKYGKLYPKDEYLYARCDLHDNDPSGTITGTILLRQKPWDESLQVHVNATGVPAPADADQGKPRLQGIHVHEFGDFSRGCASFGAHYNPEGVDHAGPQNETRHVGDWNNVEVSPEGVVNTYFNVSDVHLIGLKSIIGRGIVLHTGEDDLGLGGTEASRTTGDAGGRAACCVISWTKSLADADW